MWEITFTLNGFVVAVVFSRAKNMQDAIDFAKMEMVNKYDAVRAEWLGNAA